MNSRLSYGLKLIAGTAVVLLASHTNAQTIQWRNAVDEVWERSANWNPSNVPNTIGEHAVLGFTTAYTVELARTVLPSGVAPSSVTISNPLAVLVIQENRTLETRTGGIVNNGTIRCIGTVVLGSDSQLAGTGTFVFATGGAATLTTANAGTDAASVGSGVTIRGQGQIGGGFTINGRIAPGGIAPSPVFGAIQRNGNIILGPTVVLDMEIGGPLQTDRDRLVGTGALQLNGTLRVRISNSQFRMAPCSIYTPISGGQITGRFSSVDVPRWVQVSYAADRVVLTYVPADYNSNGSVDFFDYLDFVQEFSENRASSDVNSDGTVDFFDYLDFVATFAAPC